MSWIFRRVSENPGRKLNMDDMPELQGAFFNLIELLIDNETPGVNAGIFLRPYLDGSLDGRKGSVLITVLNEDGGAEYEYELNHVENKLCHQ